MQYSKSWVQYMTSAKYRAKVEHSSLYNDFQVGEELNAVYDECPVGYGKNRTQSMQYNYDECQVRQVLKATTSSVSLQAVSMAHAYAAPH